MLSENLSRKYLTSDYPKLEIKVGAIFVPIHAKNDLTSLAPGVFGYLFRDTEEIDKEDLEKLHRALWKIGFDGGLAGHV